MPFTRRNLKEDLEDVGSNFDGAPDLEFRMATDALELEAVRPDSGWIERRSTEPKVRRGSNPLGRDSRIEPDRPNVICGER